MDQVLDSLGKGWVFSVLDLVSSFHQITAHKNVIRLTAFSTPASLRQNNLKLFPSKARLGATDADFLGYSISPACVSPSAEKVSALVKMPMPRDLQQVHT